MHKSKNFLHEIINKNYCDDKGNKISFSIDEIIIKQSINNLDFIISKYDIDRVLFIADTNTNAVAYKFVNQNITKNNLFIFPGDCKPTIENVHQIVNISESYDFYIVFGSGTLNDIVKYAAFLSRKDYAVFITAPSVNGYTSATASIIFNNYKKTIPAQLPKYILIDLDVISNAPIRLIRSGYGDSLAYYTARIDWLFSHLLVGSYYDDEPFVWLEESQKYLLDNGNLLENRDPNFIIKLLENLLLSGLGMSLVGSSDPASQSEHMLAHTIDMKSQKSLFHGEEIAITSLFMNKLQNQIIDNNEIPQIVIDEDFENKIRNYFSNADEVIANYKLKIATLEKINFSIKWKDIKIILKQYLISHSMILAKINDIKLYQLDREDDWCSAAVFTEATKYAKFYRNRITFLDFL